MSGLPENAVTRWLGPQFQALHPLLQDLHRKGGRLYGKVELRFPRGIAGLLGRRLCRRMGLRSTASPQSFNVDIRHDDKRMYWRRRFGSDVVLSTFEPIGAWPEGHWIEQSGLLQLRLAVIVRDGEWHWQCLGARLGVLPLPAFLLPRTEAFKRIQGGFYVFRVAVTLPLLGKVFEYGGALELESSSESGPIAA